MNWHVFFQTLGFLVGGLIALGGWLYVCFAIDKTRSGFLGIGLFVGSILVLAAAMAGLKST